MRTVRAVCLMAILWCLVTGTQAQIVNVEKQRIATQDTAGWFGDVAFSVSASRSTRSFTSFGTTSHIQHKKGNDLLLLLLDLQLLKAGGEDFTNTGFAHLRYNKKLGGVVRWEWFSQVQYNSLTKVDVRFVTGTGPRFKLTQYDRARFYWGVAYMFEYEKIRDQTNVHQDHRLSSYFSFTLLPEEKVSLISTTYFQPLFKNFSDYRIYNENKLVLGISGKLALGIEFRYGYDSEPPVDVPNTTYRFLQSLEYTF